MKFVFSTTLALALLASAPALGQYSIDVMTQNQYLGADLGDIVTAEDPIAFNAAVLAALEDVAANDIPTRAHALAEIIAKRLPEVVGLQEMFIFTCTDLDPDPDPDVGCDNPDIRNAFNDGHLDLTLAALGDLGEEYVAVASVTNLDTNTVEFVQDVPGIPFVIDGVLVVVNMVDHDVILVRGDLAGDATPVDFTVYQAFGICLRPSADGCNYQVVAQAPLPPPPGEEDPILLNIERGYVGVDLSVDGKDYRFIDTHLEVQTPEEGNPLSAIVQAAQAQELIQTLANIPLDGKSLIVVGDINSSPDDDPILVDPPIPGFPDEIVPPYTQFVGSGYTDSWNLRPGDEPGYSCCQADDLSNHESELVERIDVIFSIDVPSKVKKARVLGAKVSDKTPPPGLGLWPSDHGSVAAELQFE
jgi:hypothetical protein